MCICKTKIIKTISQIKKLDPIHNCDICLRLECNNDNQELNFTKDGKEYIKIYGGWASRDGIVLNYLKKQLIVDKKYYISFTDQSDPLQNKDINFKHLLARIFKIDNYKLLDNKATVLFKDSTLENKYNIDNLYVYHKSIGHPNDIVKKCNCHNEHCRQCTNELLRTIPTDFNVIPESIHEEEEWIAIIGGFVSTHGRCCNFFGRLYKPDEKYRFFIGQKLQYAAITIAIAFKIDGYEELQNEKSTLVVSYRDNDRSNYNLSNIYIRTREAVGKINGLSSHKSERFRAHMNLNITTKMLNTKYKILPELPDYIMFEDGFIYSNKEGIGGKRFLSFSISNDANHKQYYKIHTYNFDYYVHRLICTTFHPKEGFNKIEDYKHLQSNHIDGNTLNNHSNNL